MPTEAVRTPSGALARLLAIMAWLRDPEHGCAWDVAQDFRSIAPYTIEEAYEVADACERGDLDALQDELGDLLLQVVFHARMAEEAGRFAFADVAEGIADKLERRHPHVFGDAEPTPGSWERIKAAERAAARSGGALAGVAQALPALLRAEKLGRRAARVGFDWPDPAGPRTKLLEELAEVDTATSATHEFEEVGDLLFAAAQWARKLGHDPEAALRAANAKFERRFAAMEALDPGFATRPTAEQEALWDRIKRAPD